MSCLSSRLCHRPISVSSLLSHLPIFVTLTQLFSSCLCFSPSSFIVSMCLFHVVSPLWSAHTCSSCSLGVQVRLSCTVCHPWGHQQALLSVPTAQGPVSWAQTLPQQGHSRVCLQLPMVLFCLAMGPELCPCTAPHPAMAPERCLVLGLRPS